MSRWGMLLPAGILSALLLFAVIPQEAVSGPRPLVDHLVEQAPPNTGATNLVSAVYLGYRAYDTLGEALVLLLAVSGVVYFSRGDLS